MEPQDCGGFVLGARIAGALVAIVAVLQFFGVGWVLSGPLPDYNRAYSTLGSPVYSGAFLAFCLVFAGRFDGAVIIAGLLATVSRGAWVAAALGLAYRDWPQLTATKKRLFLYGVAIGAMFLFSFKPPSDLGRVVLWRTALEAWLARPWLGWGPGCFYEIAERWRDPAWDEAFGIASQDHAHNLFLEALATTGIIGLAGLICLLYMLWGISCRRTRAALLSVFVVGMINPLPLAVKAMCLMAGCVGRVKKT
jgi:O-antigen ligase